jgi:hypothetical protein
VVRSTYSISSRTADFDAAVFRLSDGSWYRQDFVLYQKCHAAAAVKSALKVAGFTELETYGFDWQSGMSSLTKNSRRVFFLCCKPKVPN